MYRLEFQLCLVIDASPIYHRIVVDQSEL